MSPPEELEFKARLFIEKELVGLDPARRVRKGDKEYLLEVRFSAVKKEWFVDVDYLDYSRPEFKGTKYERPSEWGAAGECYSKDIMAVIDCIEQKYNVKVSVTGITPADLKKKAQEVLEEAVAPKPQEIGLFEVMESNSEQVLEGMKKDLGRFCTQAGVGKHVGEAGREFAAKTCREVLEWLIDDLDLEISNEDWSGDLKHGNNTFAQGPVSEAVGRLVVRKKLAEILHRDRESADYHAERKWGVLPREPYDMKGKSRGEQLGAQLIDIFKSGEREFLNSIGDETARKLESGRLKDAIKLFLSSYLVSMKRRVEQLR